MGSRYGESAPGAPEADPGGQTGITQTMAKIDDLLDDIPDPRLRSELRQAVNELRSARTFGLVFEDHIPEEVALPGLPVRTGSIVQNRTRPDDTTKYEVVEVDGDEAQIRPVGDGDKTTTVAVRDLMVVRRFGEPIYPGLTQVGEVRRGPDDKPAHAVINAENFHALQMLTYTHAGKVDVIYIDPPYNTGARDWKYNNAYVDADDSYRHSKWLAFMERRLLLAKRLLNPLAAAVIVTVDEKEYLRLGLLLEQVFRGSKVQMVSSVINPAGTGRHNELSRTNEFIFIVLFGDAVVEPMLATKVTERPVTWETLRRRDLASRRGTAKGGPAQFYPIYVERDTGRFVGTGDPLTVEQPRDAAPDRDGCETVLPIRDDGTEMNWGLTRDELERRAAKGYVRVGRHTPDKPQKFVITYLRSGPIADIEEGRATVRRRGSDGSVDAVYPEGKRRMPTTQWEIPSHDAQRYGTNLLQALIPGRRFPFPKSLYAIEEVLRVVVGSRPDAVVLDYFAGSGTTAHAVARLNRQDGGQRVSISITNNEVGPEEARRMRKEGLGPGDTAWESEGIFEALTCPRIEAAFTGRTPEGDPVKGDYRFVDEFPMADGFTENAAFFRLDYLDPDVVSLGRQYSAIAALLWLAAGSVGRWADRDGDEPWSVPETSNYSVLFDEDRFAEFKTMVERSERISHVWLVTNSSQSFAEMRAQLPDGLEVQMLYRDYLSNFRVNTAETFS